MSKPEYFWQSSFFGSKTWVKAIYVGSEAQFLYNPGWTPADRFLCVGMTLVFVMALTILAHSLF